MDTLVLRSGLLPCEKGRRIRELTSVVQKRFKFPENSVELYAEKVSNRGLCAIALAESLRYKLLGGLAVRRACYGVLRFVMESGAKGCEVIVSGKLRAQRAKSMKFKDGYMISSGQPVKEYTDSAVRHVLLRQGVLGIKVKIMLDWDPTGKQGPKTPPPDLVTIHPLKDEEFVKLPTIETTEIEDTVESLRTHAKYQRRMFDQAVQLVCPDFSNQDRFLRQPSKMKPTLEDEDQHRHTTIADT
ncbi:40S ribosomal protein S3-1 [Orobanche gracilis]